MSGRYDILTKEEFAAHRVRWEVRQRIGQLLESPGVPSDRQHINILDWGCGRGASVGKLLDQGFNAYGVEIDREVLQKGYPLFREHGRDPCEVIMHVEETGRFPDGFFHFIFSEEVLEHVEHINEVAREMSRLTRIDGSGVHLFPGSRRVVEPHLFMPFVHWLPKSSKRQMVIAAFLLLRIGPKWPGVDGLGIWKASEVYRSYLDEHTHYRDIMLILEGFREAGFETAYETSDSRANRWAPDFLRRNGFPGRGITLITSKSSA
jgi:SAM-dependent methyltransferase